MIAFLDLPDEITLSVLSLIAAQDSRPYKKQQRQNQSSYCLSQNCTIKMWDLWSVTFACCIDTIIRICWATSQVTEFHSMQCYYPYLIIACFRRSVSKLKRNIKQRYESGGVKRQERFGSARVKSSTQVDPNLRRFSVIYYFSPFSKPNARNWLILKTFSNSSLLEFIPGICLTVVRVQSAK